MKLPLVLLLVLLTTSSAWGQGVGFILTAPNTVPSTCTQITNPVANRSWCANGNPPYDWEVWDGTQWVPIGTGGGSVGGSGIAGQDTYWATSSSVAGDYAPVHVTAFGTNRAAIQAALDAAPVGGIVQLNCGQTYTLDAITLTMSKAGQSLLGCGVGGVTLTNGGAAATITVNVTGRGVHIEGITFEGGAVAINRPNTSNEYGTLIRGNVFENLATAIVMAGAGNQWAIERNIIQLFTGIGIDVQMQNDSCECSITGNTIAVSAPGATNAIRWLGGGDIRLLDNKVNTNGGAVYSAGAVLFNNTGVVTSEIVLVGNVISALNSAVAVDFAGSADYQSIVVTGNQINNADTLVRVGSHAVQGTISGNEFSLGGSVGIDLDSQNWHIGSNSFTNNSGSAATAIALGAAALAVTVTPQDFSLNNLTTVTSASNNIRIEGNIPVSAAEIATLSAFDGSTVYCFDCQIGPTCVGGGIGAIATRYDTRWVCSTVAPGNDSWVIFNHNGGLDASADLLFDYNISALEITSDTVGNNLILQSASSIGANLVFIGNGATTPKKYVRVKDGALDIVDDAYGSVLLSLTDAGALSLPTGYSGGGLQTLCVDNTGLVTTAGCLGSGNVTGTAAAGQVTVWSGVSSITGYTDFLWDDSTHTLTMGTASTNTATVTLYNAASANATSLQAGNATNAVTYILPTDDGVSGAALITNGSGQLSWTTASVGDLTGGGTAGRIAFWDGAKSLTGSAAFLWTDVSATMTMGVASTTTGLLKLYNASSANATSIEAGNATSSVTYILPVDDGAAGSALVTDGAGQLSWDSGAGSRPHTCIVLTGDPGAASPFLDDDNDSPVACQNHSGVDWTIISVTCWADAGSPTVTPITTGGAATSILSGALTCGTADFAAGTLNGTPVVHSFDADGVTCSSSPCSIDWNITTAGGVARYISGTVTYTLAAAP